MEMSSREKPIPDLYHLHDILFDGEAATRFLFEEGVYQLVEVCNKCSGAVKADRKRARWRCGKDSCRWEGSFKAGSFFARANLSSEKVLLLGYLWLNRVPVTSAIVISGMSSRTVTQYFTFYRELVADSLDIEDCLVGGDGIIVEVDETKMGKRKYNRGHHVEGVWVVGGIERTAEGKVFFAVVEDRSAESLLAVLRRYLRPGSIIFSDMWRGYSSIPESLGMEHRTVNHSVEFVSSDGTHTNSIEATWCGLKLLIPKRNRTKDVQLHLWEYIWRKRYSSSLWNALIGAMKEVAYE